MLTDIRKKNRSLACEKRLKGKRWSFLLDKATEENWENYKTKLDSLLKKKLNIKKNDDDTVYLESLSKDDLWDLIATSIIKCARLTLPEKKSLVRRTNTEEKKESNNIKKDLKIIGSLCQLCSSRIGQQIDSADKYSMNIKITRINSLYKTEIKELYESIWTKKRHEDLKMWWKIIYTKAQQARKKEELEEINIAVEQRCEAIQGELKHMISSLLERSSKRVVIDRIVKDDNSDIVLVNQKEEVLEEVRSHFNEQFRKRRTKGKEIKVYTNRFISNRDSKKVLNRYYS